MSLRLGGKYPVHPVKKSSPDLKLNYKDPQHPQKPSHSHHLVGRSCRSAVAATPPSQKVVVHLWLKFNHEAYKEHKMEGSFFMCSLRSLRLNVCAQSRRSAGEATACRLGTSRPHPNQKPALPWQRLFCGALLGYMCGFLKWFDLV